MPRLPSFDRLSMALEYHQKRKLPHYVIMAFLLLYILFQVLILTGCASSDRGLANLYILKFRYAVNNQSIPVNMNDKSSPLSSIIEYFPTPSWSSYIEIRAGMVGMCVYSDERNLLPFCASRFNREKFAQAFFNSSKPHDDQQLIGSSLSLMQVIGSDFTALNSFIPRNIFDNVYMLANRLFHPHMLLLSVVCALFSFCVTLWCVYIQGSNVVYVACKLSLFSTCIAFTLTLLSYNEPHGAYSEYIMLPLNSVWRGVEITTGSSIDGLFIASLSISASCALIQWFIQGEQFRQLRKKEITAQIPNSLSIQIPTGSQQTTIPCHSQLEHSIANGMARNAPADFGPRQRSLSNRTRSHS